MIIKNGYIVTMDQENRLYRDGAVVVTDTDIIDIGPTNEILRKHRDDEIIDANGKMVLPGFVNTHNHLYQTVLRGLSDDGEGVRPSDYRWDIDLLRELDKEVCYASATLGIAEMIRSGVTCTQDSHYINFHKDSIDGIAKASLDAGLRIVLGRGSWDLEGLAPPELTEDIDTALKESVKVSEKWHDGEKIKVIYEASLLSQVSDELIISTKNAAQEKGLGWGIHIQGPLGSHKDDPRTCEPSLRQYGGRAIEYLNSLGVLGLDSLLIHCTFTTSREIPILAQTGTPVAHCPCANAWAGRSVVTPVPSMLDKGVKVGLGTDGALTNDSLDMMHAMNFAALIHKVNYGNSRAMTAERILDISTRIASKALGMDKLVGSIEKGKRADLVFVDMKGLGMAPSLLPVKNLVYSANSSCVESVMINGEFVMQNRRITTIDLEKAILNGEKAAWSLIEKSGHLERNPGFLERGGLYYSN
jgi:5-methylthioadenosine/S-adenosylhomocysteine deaminase